MGKDIYAEVKLGENMCGHNGIVHGGCIATLIDELCGWTFHTNGHGKGFTANLNINYRRPLPNNVTVLVRCSITQVIRRKKMEMVKSTLKELPYLSYQKM